MYLMSLNTTMCLDAEAGREEKLDLAPRVLVVGPNGGGKSRIPLSAMLLATGKLWGVLWRDSVALPETIIDYAPEDEGLLVSGRMSDGTEAEYSTGGRGKGKSWKPTSAMRDAGPWVLPTQHLVEQMRKGPDTVHAFIADILAQGDLSIYLKNKPVVAGGAEEPPVLAMEFQAPSRDGGRPVTTMRELQARLTRAERSAASMKADLERDTLELEQLRRGLRGEVNEGQIHTAQAVVTMLEQTYAATLARVSAGQGGLEKQIENATAELENMHRVLATAEGQIESRFPLLTGDVPSGSLPSEPPGLDAARAAREDLIQKAVASGNAVLGRETVNQCPTCGGSVTREGLVAWVTRASNLLNRLRQEDNSIVSARQAWQAECQRITQEWEAKKRASWEARRAADNKLAEYAGRVRQKEADIAALKASRVEAPPGDVIDMPEDKQTTLEDAVAMLDGARKAQTELIEAARLWNDCQTKSKLVTEKTELAEWWSRYTVALQGAVRKILGVIMDDYLVKVRRYLPSSWDLVVKLEDTPTEPGGKVKSVFRPGLRRKGKVQRGLSGSEEALVLTAMAMALLDYLPKTPEYSLVVLPSDRDITGDTLAEIMRAWAHAPEYVQIILTSTNMPAGKKPGGWLIAQVGPQPVKRTRKGKKSGDEAESSDKSNEESSEEPVAADDRDAIFQEEGMGEVDDDDDDGDEPVRIIKLDTSDVVINPFEQDDIYGQDEGGVFD